MEIQDLVAKLKSPIREIRNRAIENINDKIQYELIDLNPIVDNTDFCNVIISWFENCLTTESVQSKSTVPELHKVLQLLKAVIEQSINGKSILENLNSLEILESWRANYESYQDNTNNEALKHILELLKCNSDESQLVSTYGASLKSTLVEEESSSCQPSPSQYLNQRNMSLPPRLLKSSIGPRNYSPVARTYIKKVHFNEDFNDDVETETTEKTTIISSPFEWHPLAKLDRDKIALIHSALISYKPEIIRDACIELTSDTFEDFPAEIFIQRPEIVFALQDILLVNSNSALKALSAKALAELCIKLLQRFEVSLEMKSSRKDSILLMTLPHSDQTTNVTIDTENVDDDTNSFADQINTTGLVIAKCANLIYIEKKTLNFLAYEPYEQFKK